MAARRLDSPSWAAVRPGAPTAAQINTANSTHTVRMGDPLRWAGRSPRYIVSCAEYLRGRGSGQAAPCGDAIGAAAGIIIDHLTT